MSDIPSHDAVRHPSDTHPVSEEREVRPRLVARVEVERDGGTSPMYLVRYPADAFPTSLASEPRYELENVGRVIGTPVAAVTATMLIAGAAMMLAFAGSESPRPRGWRSRRSSRCS